MNGNLDQLSTLFQNIPPQLRNTYTKCPDCGMIVSKQNYCPVCGNALGDGTSR